MRRALLRYRHLLGATLLACGDKGDETTAEPMTTTGQTTGTPTTGAAETTGTPTTGAAETSSSSLLATTPALQSSFLSARVNPPLSRSSMYRSSTRLFLRRLSSRATRSNSTGTTRAQA